MGKSALDRLRSRIDAQEKIIKQHESDIAMLLKVNRAYVAFFKDFVEKCPVAKDSETEAEKDEVVCRAFPEPPASQPVEEVKKPMKQSDSEPSDSKRAENGQICPSSRDGAEAEPSGGQCQPEPRADCTCASRSGDCLCPSRIAHTCSLCLLECRGCPPGWKKTEGAEDGT